MLFLTVIMCISCTQSEKNIFEIKDAYFGQKPPGLSPDIFAPGILSHPDRLESKVVFSHDGSECYFGVVEIKDNRASNKIYYTQYVNNRWTEQVETPFSGSSPFVSAKGKKLYFARDGDIWMVKRTLNGWGEPQLLPAPINSTARETSYTETSNGVAYVSSNRSGGIGKGYDIWRVATLTNQSLQAENLGPIVNSSSFDVSPLIAPDGSYLIFGSERNGRRGEAHLYICFSKGNGEWTSPINMNSSGDIVNNETAHHSGPSLSPDGKYLFFKRHESMYVMDIYWINIGVIEKIKERAFQD